MPYYFLYFFNCLIFHHSKTFYFTGNMSQPRSKRRRVELTLETKFQLIKDYWRRLPSRCWIDFLSYNLQQLVTVLYTTCALLYVLCCLKILICWWWWQWWYDDNDVVIVVIITSCMTCFIITFYDWWWWQWLHVL